MSVPAGYTPSQCGTGEIHCATPWTFLDNHPDNSTFRNEVVQVSPPILIYLFGEDFYKGREQILGFGFSYILPKSSPLRVRVQGCTLTAIIVYQL